MSLKSYCLRFAFKLIGGAQVYVIKILCINGHTCVAVERSLLSGRAMFVIRIEFKILLKV